MNKGIIILAAGWLTMAQTAWAQQDEWTLEQCIAHAMEHNITLQKARLTTQSAEEDVKGSRAALLPSLSASTNQSLGYRPGRKRDYRQWPTAS